MRRLKCVPERDYYITAKQFRELKRMYYALSGLYEDITDCEGDMFVLVAPNRPDHAIVNIDELRDIHDEFPDFENLVDRIQQQRLKKVPILNITANS